MNPQESKTRMIASDEDKKRFACKVIKQLARHDEFPGDLPPVTKDMVRIFTTRGINDGLQNYSEYAIIDAEPEFAKQCVETTFKGQFTHTGEQLESNAKNHEITRAVYIDEFMAQFKKRN